MSPTLQPAVPYLHKQGRGGGKRAFPGTVLMWLGHSTPPPSRAPCGCVCARVWICVRTWVAVTAQCVSVVITDQNGSLSRIKSVQRQIRKRMRFQGEVGGALAAAAKRPHGPQSLPSPPAHQGVCGPSLSPGAWGSGCVRWRIVGGGLVRLGADFHCWGGGGKGSSQGSALCLRTLLLKYFFCLIFFPFEILSQVFSF